MATFSRCKFVSRRKRRILIGSIETLLEGAGPSAEMANVKDKKASKEKAEKNKGIDTEHAAVSAYVSVR